MLTDEVWADMAEVLAQVKRKDGRPPEQSDRMFVEAVLYMARTGVPWRDLPKEFGHWDAVYSRFRRWEGSGVWRKWGEGLQQDRFKLAKQGFIDSTIVRAHQPAAGALKKTGGQEAQAVGRSRGGFSTKIHLGCLEERSGVAMVITAGACHDAPLFETVCEQLPAEHGLEHGVMDQGDASDQIRHKLREEGREPVIPPRSNRHEQDEYDKTFINYGIKLNV